MAAGGVVSAAAEVVALTGRLVGSADQLGTSSRVFTAK